MRWPWRRRPAPLLMNPAQLEALRGALAAGGSSLAELQRSEDALGGAGFALKVESIEATMRNVTFEEWHIEWGMAKLMIGKRYRHDRTGEHYVVVDAMRGKVPYRFRWSLDRIRKVLRGERRWVVGVVYEAAYGGKPGHELFWRPVTDFRGGFSPMEIV